MRPLLRWHEAVLIAAAALIVRAGYVFTHEAPARLAGDALEYHSYAASVLSEGRYEGDNGSRAGRMPGYPLFLSLVYSFFGTSPRAVQSVQCLLGTLTCLLIFLWAAEILKPPWPLACGLAAAFYYDLIAPSGSLLTEVLYSFLLTASFSALFYKSMQAGPRAALSGLAFGLTCLVRPEVLPSAAVILCLLPLISVSFARRHALMALAVFLIPVSIWTARNALVFHRFIPVSTVGGFNAYMGLRLPLEHQPVEQGPVHQPPEGLGELERDADYMAEYRRLRRSVPLPAAVRAYAFNLLSVYYPFLPGYDWTYALLIPFWLAGLWWSRSSRELRLVAGMVIWLSAVYSFLAGPVSRYRFGFAPCLILLSGLGAQMFSERARESKLYYRAAAAWGAFNLAVWIWAPGLRQAALWLKARIWG